MRVPDSQTQKIVFGSLLIQLMSPLLALGQPQIQSLSDLANAQTQFVLKEQIQVPTPIYWPGEWPTHIHSTLVPVVVGVGKPVGHDQEASAFTTASVINQLASTYFQNFDQLSSDNQTRIPEAIQRGEKTFSRYQEQELFNFYPSRQWKGVKVHQPADMSLFLIWKGFTNIPEDSDTSSVVYAAKAYAAQLRGQELQLPTSVAQSWSLYRDLDRKPHFYNKRENRINTGAFMTWQFDENAPTMPRFYFASPEKGTRIPFNRNDVDCIVNLNVLRALALTKTEQIPGRTEACQLITEMVLQKEHATCGIYYPNSLNLAYSIASVVEAGENCFAKETQSAAVVEILKMQRPDGSWTNEGNIWQDKIQSTVFALAALTKMGNLQDPGVERALLSGTAYLVRHSLKREKKSFSFDGEVFFTATAIARSLVVWKSSAYTTAISADVFFRMNRLYPDLQIKDYLAVPYSEDFQNSLTGGM